MVGLVEATVRGRNVAIKPSRPALTVYTLLLLVTAVGLLLHRVTAYDYPTLAAYSNELNVLGDLYEGIFLLPVGLLALWAMGKGRPWGNLLATAVGAHMAYNYAMAVTGLQNLWIFLWVAKLTLGGATVALLWPTLTPATEDRPRAGRLLIATYLALAGAAIGAPMARRLLASAHGLAVGMTGASSGVVDWADITVRDPIIFFALVLPFLVSAVIGLVGDTRWGRNSAALCLVFIPTMVSLILFTGPVPEYLLHGAIPGSALGMSLMMALMAVLAVISLVWLFRKPPAARRRT